MPVTTGTIRRKPIGAAGSLQLGADLCQDVAARIHAAIIDNPR